MGRGPRRPYSAAYSGCHFFLARKRGTGLFLNSRGAGGGRGEASPPDSVSTQPAPVSLITEFRLRPESSTRCAKCPLSRRLSSGPRAPQPGPCPAWGCVAPQPVPALAGRRGAQRRRPLAAAFRGEETPAERADLPEALESFLPTAALLRGRASVTLRVRGAAWVLPRVVRPRGPRRCSGSLRTPAGPPFSAPRLPAAAPSPPGARAHRAGQAPCPGGQTRRLGGPARRWAGPCSLRGSREGPPRCLRPRGAPGPGLSLTVPLPGAPVSALPGGTPGAGFGPTSSRVAPSSPGSVCAHRVALTGTVLGPGHPSLGTPFAP